LKQRKRGTEKVLSPVYGGKDEYEEPSTRA
jgi:hypothetical protein